MMLTEHPAQGGLKGFPHDVVGFVLDQFQCVFAVKSAHHQFHLRAVRRVRINQPLCIQYSLNAFTSHPCETPDA